uniref:Putative uncharacterized protein YOR345C n=1 Tax=Saccharomyces cerevisiae (strain ATCC 204508 / S288c) TaxID=559292 RepID=YO345_YEAST|nr:RecName: Full=Putative uncharacterized protein YOR345C [Saccharomyces cerevisiae S288C]AAT93263.1 YOR345C [Saccharomyces cerevisiae]CAA99673.1 unnamed protein product [Saccharomyces cerevisiae]
MTLRAIGESSPPPRSACNSSQLIFLVVNLKVPAVGLELFLLVWESWLTYSIKESSLNVDRKDLAFKPPVFAVKCESLTLCWLRQLFLSGVSLFIEYSKSLSNKSTRPPCSPIAGYA